MTARSKSHWRDLAICGGPPAFDEPLHVGRPNVGDRSRLFDRINDALDRKWLSNDGPYVRQLEQQLASICGARHCVAVANGTVALQLGAVALFKTRLGQAVGETKPDAPLEVLVPSLTFVATPHAFSWQGLRPVFVDVDPRSLTMDARHAKCSLSSRTIGICGVHLFGELGGAEQLERIADEHRLPLMFDASHALTNVATDGRCVGQFGDLEAFSLHATKFVGCGEGGAIVTSHDDVADEVRRLRNFGFSSQGKVEHVGINAKMSELAAAMGLSMLEQREKFVSHNRANFHIYREVVAHLTGITLHEADVERTNCQYVVIRVDAGVARLQRDELLRILQAENVLARPYFSPACHELPPYAPQFQKRLPQAERISRQLIALPTGESVTSEDIRAIAQIIQLAQSRTAQAA